MAGIEIPGQRVFRVAAPDPPADGPDWLPAVLDRFRTNLADPGYPCNFGRYALQHDELYGSWVDRDGDLDPLRGDLAAFLDGTRPYPRRRMVLAAFLAPEPATDHAGHGRRFWSTLQFLHDHDDRPWPADIPAAPSDAHWEFSYHGTPMFVFAAAPTHRARRSRNLGPGLVLLFQPRNVFAGIEGGTRAGTKARRNIRRDLAAWDTVDPHPSMGDYGDPSNYEWTQYYIADDASALHRSCPLRI